MALDQVVMEVEEIFDIKIPDERAEQIVTAGQLHEYVMKECPRKYRMGDICLSSATFYRLRTGICHQLGMNRSRLRPATQLVDLVPREERREFWKCLQQQVGLTLPDLVRPDWIVILCTLLVIGAAAIPGWFAFLLWGTAGVLTVVPTALLAFGLLAARVTASTATQLPPTIETMRGLTYAVLCRNFGKLKTRVNGLSPIETWRTLQAIIVANQGVRYDQVTKSACFQRELLGDDL